jgi:hypothetical protein
MTDINLEPIYREFVLKNASIWSVIVEFIGKAKWVNASEILEIDADSD